jgi:hypothetical protein
MEAPQGHAIASIVPGEYGPERTTVLEELETTFSLVPVGPDTTFSFWRDRTTSPSVVDQPWQHVVSGVSKPKGTLRPLTARLQEPKVPEQGGVVVARFADQSDFAEKLRKDQREGHFGDYRLQMAKSEEAGARSWRAIAAGGASPAVAQETSFFRKHGRDLGFTITSPRRGVGQTSPLQRPSQESLASARSTVQQQNSADEHELLQEIDRFERTHLERRGPLVVPAEAETSQDQGLLDSAAQAGGGQSSVIQGAASRAGSTSPARPGGGGGARMPSLAGLPFSSPPAAAVSPGAARSPRGPRRDLPGTWDSRHLDAVDHESAEFLSGALTHRGGPSSGTPSIKYDPVQILKKYSIC